MTAQKKQRTDCALYLGGEGRSRDVSLGNPVVLFRTGYGLLLARNCHGAPVYHTGNIPGKAKLLQLVQLAQLSQLSHKGWRSKNQARPGMKLLLMQILKYFTEINDIF